MFQKVTERQLSVIRERDRHLLSLASQGVASVAFCDITKGTDFYDYIAGWKGETFLFSDELISDYLKTFTM